MEKEKIQGEGMGRNRKREEGRIHTSAGWRIH